MTKKIAIIIPVEFHAGGGTLRGAKMFAQALLLGCKQSNESCEIIFSHLDLPQLYTKECFSDLHPEIKTRPYRWKNVSAEIAQTALIYAGKDEILSEKLYQLPDDRMNQFLDCDLLIFISNRLNSRLLPLYDHVDMVFDYIQRHVDLGIAAEANQVFLETDRCAKKVLVTTQATYQDAIEYAEVPLERVVKVPMLVPDFSVGSVDKSPYQEDYFIWSTNLSPHKNQETTFAALREYYEVHGGRFKCRITGVDTSRFDLNALFGQSRAMIEIHGELPCEQYRSVLSGARFLLHSALIDNGTFSVIEAAYYGIPSLSSRYPAMEEMDENFNLHLSFMNPRDTSDMAKQLKVMENEYQARAKLLPSQAELRSHSIESDAIHYWNAIRDCL